MGIQLASGVIKILKINAEQYKQGHKLLYLVNIHVITKNAPWSEIITILKYPIAKNYFIKVPLQWKALYNCLIRPSDGVIKLILKREMIILLPKICPNK